MGQILRMYLNHDDCPNADDRDAAARIVREIISNDVVTKGSFIIEGYSAACRIAQALTAARADERRRGLSTPFRLREIVPAKGSTAVVARWPNLRPLYHWTTIEGVRFQSYRLGNGHQNLSISDDARIVLKPAGDGWNIRLDGEEIAGADFQRCFRSASDAVQRAIFCMQQKTKYAR